MRPAQKNSELHIFLWSTWYHNREYK